MFVSSIFLLLSFRPASRPAGRPVGRSAGRPAGHPPARRLRNICRVVAQGIVKNPNSSWVKALPWMSPVMTTVLAPAALPSPPPPPPQKQKKQDPAVGAQVSIPQSFVVGFWDRVIVRVRSDVEGVGVQGD